MMLDFAKILASAFKDKNWLVVKQLLEDAYLTLKLFNSSYVHMDFKEGNMMCRLAPEQGQGGDLRYETALIDLEGVVRVGAPIGR